MRPRKLKCNLQCWSGRDAWKNPSRDEIHRFFDYVASTRWRPALDTLTKRSDRGSRSTQSSVVWKSANYEHHDYLLELSNGLPACARQSGGLRLSAGCAAPWPAGFRRLLILSWTCVPIRVSIRGGRTYRFALPDTGAQTVPRRRVSGYQVTLGIVLPGSSNLPMCTLESNR